ncbi:hypothetical protein BDR07DRAFT_479174 [Suillus spraguei]|nr:hypothetical protein BDR07DRAFT_479174 [Suillus spraguei]
MAVSIDSSWQEYSHGQSPLKQRQSTLEASACLPSTSLVLVLVPLEKSRRVYRLPIAEIRVPNFQSIDCPDKWQRVKTTTTRLGLVILISHSLDKFTINSAG